MSLQEHWVWWLFTFRMVTESQVVTLPSRLQDRCTAPACATIRGDWGHVVLRERVAPQSEVKRAIVSEENSMFAR